MWGAAVNEYRIERVPEGDSVPLAGDPEAGPWSAASRLEVAEHPWDPDASGPVATAGLLYDDRALYLQFLVDDDRIRAADRPLNGEVWRDSCVELFASPRPEQRAYVNFEANCLGQFLVGYGPNREDRRLIESSVAERIRVETSVEGPRKDPAPDDQGWWLAAALPFEALGEFVGRDVTPGPGTEWRGNAYCCRGEPEPRYVAWAPIDAPDPDFHRPEAFGRFTFG